MTEQLTADKEKVILAAARKRFAYYGYSKATMDEIASDVAMGKASLYYYFPTKEVLFQAVLSQEKDQFLHEIQIILKSDSTASEKLYAYVHKRFQLFRDLVNLSAISFSRIADVRSDFNGFFVELEKQELELVKQILQVGKRSGEFGIVSIPHTAELIQHVLQGLRMRRIKHSLGSRLDDEMYESLQQEGKRLMELMLHGMLK